MTSQAGSYIVYTISTTGADTGLEVGGGGQKLIQSRKASTTDKPKTKIGGGGGLILGGCTPLTPP